MGGGTTRVRGRSRFGGRGRGGGGAGRKEERLKRGGPYGRVKKEWME